MMPIETYLLVFMKPLGYKYQNMFACIYETIKLFVWGLTVSHQGSMMTNNASQGTLQPNQFCTLHCTLYYTAYCKLSFSDKNKVSMVLQNIMAKYG